jgi:DNA mismatch repair ATPase MutS
VIVHEGVRRRADRERRAIALYERGIDRLDDAWQGKGASGSEWLTQEHPYAGDLDILGSGSLFERLCTARTRLGERTLAQWLLAPASPAEVRARQESVAELRDDLDFREAVALSGEEVESKLDLDELTRWLDANVAPLPGWGRHVALMLSILAVPAVGLAVPSFFVSLAGLSEPALAKGLVDKWPVLAWGHLPLLGLIVIDALFALPLRARVRGLLHGLEEASAELGLVASVLSLIEDRTSKSPKLHEIRSRLELEEESASHAIDRLRKLVELLDSTRNQIFAVIAPLLLWRTQLAYRVADWKLRCREHVSVWLESVGETEALIALSTFAWERNDLSYPEIVEDVGPLFEATQVGHPLIPHSRRVDNDVSMGANASVLIVSGSNMSGKSTLMRTVGVATVLALSGAPVCAKRLRLSPLRIGASIRINDSLAAGQSKFYAEILRIRQIVEFARDDGGFLFLLDEILHGTNSHDRRIGAQAVIETLVSAGAIGLVSTHDLALARMADTLDGKATNVHFEDHMEGDRMVFDYRMRPGVVERSNALALMRAVGLEVGGER